MSQFTPITLTGTLSSSAGKQLYAEVDGTGMESQNQLFDLVLTVNGQSTGDASTRKANEYNGIDVEPGMWITDTNGDVCLRIQSISQKTEQGIACVAEDVDMLSYRLNALNSITAGNAIVVFSQNSEGEAVITDTTSFVAGGLDKIQSRFVVNEADDRVKFSHASAPNVEKGDIVTINGSGNIVKFGTAGGSAVKVGTVLDTIRNGKDVFVKPFNDIIRNYKDPEALTANPGGVYYTDPNNAGEITTVAGGKASYMHLNTAIASTQIAGTAIPAATDLVILNDVTIFNGPGGASVPADIDAFKTLINNSTSSHNVTATSAATPVSVVGGDFEPNYASNDYYSVSDSYIVTGKQGDPPAVGEITIGDGVNAPQTILFDNPDDTLNLGDVYDVISPDAMLIKFQDAINNGALDLVAELVNMGSYDGETVKISTIGSATGVTLTNVAPAAFGNNVVGANSWTGIGMSATVGSPVLTLNRAAGGPIKISGSPVTGGYINTGGAVSSNSGRVPFLLLMESEGGGGVAETGVNTRVDYNQNPSATSSDGDTTGLTITYTPFGDGAVIVKINGLQINLGNGAKDQAAYFSADGGTTAKSVAAIAAGDTLYWMGSIASYELETDDDIDFVYDASSNDV
jgi:hypothetical protein